MLLERTTPLQLQELVALAQLEALRPEWSALWRRVPMATPFQSPEWLIACWRHLGEGELSVLALRRAGRLVGLAPLCIYTAPESGERKLLLLGSGISDALDLLLEPDVAADCMQVLWRWLACARGRWDLCDFQQLRSGSPLLGAVPPGWADDVAVQDSCPVLALPPTVEELWPFLAPRLLANLRYGRRRALRLGTPHCERADSSNFSELFAAFLRLHGARWARRGMSGMLADDAIQSFHREVAPGLLAAGILRLYALRLNGQCIAVYYGFLDRGRAWYYLGGFDPQCSILSPGTLLIGHAIEEAIREGAREFDFLRGREDYKYQWGARDRPNMIRKLRLTLPGNAGGSA